MKNVQHSAVICCAGSIFMKNDARIRYTKMVIKDSFVQLLKKKPVEKITVKEICKMAQINRATFYRYYENQYDLLSVIENDMFQNIQETIKEQTADLNSLIKEILNSLYKNKDEWILLMGNHADPRIVSKIYIFCYSHFERRYQTEEQKMRYRFTVYGFSGLIDYWIKNGMQEPPDKMADYMISYSHNLNSMK